MARAATVVEQAWNVLLPLSRAPKGGWRGDRYATLNGGKRLRAFLVMESAALFQVNQTCAVGCGLGRDDSRLLAGA